MHKSAVILFIVFSHAVYPQENIDSLISSWNKKAGEFLEVSRADSACKYGNCSLEMLDSKIIQEPGLLKTAETRKLMYQKAEALSFLVSAYGMSGELARAKECYTDALDIYQEFNDAELIYQLFIRMGRAYDMTTRYAIAISYYRMALDEAINNNDLEDQALCYHFIGLNNRYLGNFSEALKYHLKDLAIQETLGNKNGIGNAYITIAVILNTLKDRTAAIEKLEAAKALFEEIGDTSGIATVYNDLGNTFLIMGDTLKALQNHQHAARLRNAIKEYDGIGASNAYIAGIYLEKGNYKKSLHYLQLAKTAFGQNINLDGVMHTYISISQVYERKNDLDSSLMFMDKAEQTANDIMNTLGLIKIYSNRGEIWLREHKYKQAVYDFNKALNLAREQKNYKYIFTINHLLANTYQQTGNYKLAFEHQHTSIQFKDSVNTKANLNAAMQMDMEYNYQKEKLKNTLVQEQKDELNKAILKNQRTQKKLYFAGVILFLVVSVGLWNRLRFIRKAGNELLLRKEEAERQHMIAESEKLRATKSEKVKEQFLANMSHEIRTPMNAIKGITEILIRNKHLPTQEKYLDAIRQSSENLLVILNEILDLSKLEAGKIEPENISFEPLKVINSVKDILRFKAEEKGLKLKLDTDPDLPHSLCGDPTHVSQILLNLASNAVKFTNKGSVTIKTHVKERNDEKAVIEFRIIDTGIGISPDKLDDVFETFTQADTDTTRKYGGTGLGLTICKRLVELHNGRIRVESELNKGSTFIVEIPFVLSAVVEMQEIAEIDKSLSDLHILLVEDNEFNVLVANDLLESTMPGVSIDVAVNGLEAVTKVKAHPYDLILMDIQMPEMDGYEATRLIRKMDGEKKAIPIIAMTANVMKAEVDRCFETGMNGYISKPFEPADLLQQIKKTLLPV